MRPRPWVQIPITDILDDTGPGLRVRFPSGRTAVLPKSEIEYALGAVIVHPWLAERLRRSASSSEDSQ